MRPSYIRKINSRNPEPEIIAEAATIIKNGGVVVFPTRCLYGLGADALDADAVGKVFKIKQRPAENPVLVLIHARRQLDSLVTNISPAAAAIMEVFWPGRVTLPRWLRLVNTPTRPSVRRTKDQSLRYWA